MDSVTKVTVEKLREIAAMGPPRLYPPNGRASLEQRAAVGAFLHAVEAARGYFQAHGVEACPVCWRLPADCGHAPASSEIQPTGEEGK